MTKSERNQAILSIRPVLRIKEDAAGVQEIADFQNTTLRPILKLQHSFLMELTQSKFLPRYPEFLQFSEIQMVKALTSWLSKDLETKKIIEGAVLGLMTTEELKIYLKNEKEFQKRIRAFVIERIRSGLTDPGTWNLA